MNRHVILLPGLFVLGTAAGMVLQDSIDTEDAAELAAAEPAANSSPATTGHDPRVDAFLVSQSSDAERIQRLEKQIESLSARIDQLERAAIAAQQSGEAQTGALTSGATTGADAAGRNRSPALTVGHLVRAGIAEMLAEDIIRRKNEIDLKTLELRDRAIREGYIGTSRYSQALNDLLAQDVSLREELGDDGYDRYLYATGQTNRVNIASVMLGSAAEQAGMQAGDVILSYGDRQMFSWSELQEATTLGERGEYVSVTVLRDGQLVSLWLPRGPMGVRLSALRLEP